MRLLGREPEVPPAPLGIEAGGHGNRLKQGALPAAVRSDEERQARVELEFVDPGERASNASGLACRWIETHRPDERHLSPRHRSSVARCVSRVEAPNAHATPVLDGAA